MTPSDVVKAARLEWLLNALTKQRKSNRTEKRRRYLQGELVAIDERRRLAEVELLVMGWTKTACQRCRGTGSTTTLIGGEPSKVMCIDCSGAGISWLDPFGHRKVPGA